MLRQPPRVTLTDTPLPYSSPFRSVGRPTNRWPQTAATGAGRRVRADRLHLACDGARPRRPLCDVHRGDDPAAGRRAAPAPAGRPPDPAVVPPDLLPPARHPPRGVRPPLARKADAVRRQPYLLSRHRDLRRPHSGVVRRQGGGHRKGTTL